MNGKPHLRFSVVPNWPDSFKPNVMGLRISGQPDDRTPPWRAVLGVYLEADKDNNVTVIPHKVLNAQRTPETFPIMIGDTHVDVHKGFLKINDQIVTTFPIFVPRQLPFLHE